MYLPVSQQTDLKSRCRSSVNRTSAFSPVQIYLMKNCFKQSRGILSGFFHWEKKKNALAGPDSSVWPWKSSLKNDLSKEAIFSFSRTNLPYFHGMGRKSVWGMLRSFQVKMRHLGEEDSGGTLYASDEYCAGLKKRKQTFFFS